VALPQEQFNRSSDWEFEQLLESALRNQFLRQRRAAATGESAGRCPADLEPKEEETRNESKSK